MKLDDFLKYKKVRYINLDGKGLTKNKEYELLGVTDRSCIVSDNGCEIWASMDNFEPVSDDLSKSDTEINTSANSVDLHPEFKALDKPKFKVGDKVYCPISGGSIFTLHEQDSDCYPLFLGTGIYEDETFDYTGVWRRGQKVPSLYHATEENYKKLSDFYPHIKFEAPPKPLTGSDLTRVMLEKAWKYVPCYVSVNGDESAAKEMNAQIVREVNTSLQNKKVFMTGAIHWDYAVPFDPRTGEPLTESILND